MSYSIVESNNNSSVITLNFRLLYIVWQLNETNAYCLTLKGSLIVMDGKLRNATLV